MKVEVTLKTKTSREADSRFSLTVGMSETVAGIKERLAGLQKIPFPDQDLIFDGRVLPDAAKLSASGVGDGAALEFVVKASEATLVGQFAELLRVRALSVDELGLIYCYKHGVAVGQALQMLGCEGELLDFVKNEKKFLFEGGRVSLVRDEAASKTHSVDEDSTAPKAISNPTNISSRVYNIASLLEVRLKLMADEPNVFAQKCRCVGSLTSAIVPQAAYETEGDTAHFASLPHDLDNDGSEADEAETWSPDSEQYLELHHRISSRSFNSKIAQTLSDVVKLVTENVCFAVDHHVKGGSVGRGTAINSCTDAAVVFFLAGLPPNMHSKWLPSLLKATVGILAEHLKSTHAANSIRIVGESVQLSTQDLTVDLYFSPVFQTYAETIKTLAEQGPQERGLHAASPAKERVQFIARQPSQVKVTMRLLKWWRDQQDWSSNLVRPSNEILELMVVYSAVQTKPQDQRMAIANVMSLLSRFNEMRIVWSNYYSKEDVWAPLLRQRPLLMDPANPFVNVADPQTFDARELMEKASSTHFFW